MSTLSDRQKQLLFDYCLGLTSKKEAAQAEALIGSNKQAAELYRRLQSAVAPLSALEPSACPDQLAERTVQRLTELARSGEDRLKELLASEQHRPVTVKFGWWRNLAEMIALAAAIVLIAGVLIPTLKFARQKYWKQRCAAQLGNIFTGLSNYISDHDGQSPLSAFQPGTSWYRVGYQGKENLSNTRPFWLLIKLGYISDPSQFVCPGRRQGRVLQISITDVTAYFDFPDRRYITYSPRIHCPNSTMNCTFSNKPILSDLNPVFEDIPTNCVSGFQIRLDERRLTSNSRNHNGRGQNVLFGDGAVGFFRIRKVNGDDDIFLLDGMSVGSEICGCEVPSCEKDAFLAP